MSVCLPGFGQNPHHDVETDQALRYGSSSQVPQLALYPVTRDGASDILPHYKAKPRSGLRRPDGYHKVGRADLGSGALNPSEICAIDNAMLSSKQTRPR